MAILSRDQILDAQDLATEVVSVPEWGGDVIVRALTGFERDQFEASFIDLRGKRPDVKINNVRARLVALTVVDEGGERLFSEQDIAALGRKSAAALDRIFSVAQRLSKISQADVEEMVENFDEGQSADSTSA